eukprot:3185495-Amphidinium_carterae.2
MALNEWRAIDLFTLWQQNVYLLEVLGCHENVLKSCSLRPQFGSTVGPSPYRPFCGCEGAVCRHCVWHAKMSNKSSSLLKGDLSQDLAGNAQDTLLLHFLFCSKS